MDQDIRLYSRQRFEFGKFYEDRGNRYYFVDILSDICDIVVLAYGSRG
jgi:hypothetical protein